MSRRGRALWTWLATFALAFTVGSSATPPDAFTQLLVVAVALLVTVPVAYWLVYLDGFDSVGVPYHRLPLAVVAGAVVELLLLSSWRVVRPASLAPATGAELGYAVNTVLSVAGLAAGWWLVASERLTRRGFRL